MGVTMLRIEMHHTVDALTIRLQGRFTGQGAEQVRTLVTHSRIEKKLIIDLVDVMFIDAVGEEVLSFLKRLGAEFVAETSYCLDVCERLLLPLALKRISHVTGSSGMQNGHASRDSLM